MAEEEKTGFGTEYETNSHRAHLSAYVLIAGLVLEIINAVLWFKGLETLAEMVAVLLIVAGVWGEVFFGNKARIAGDRQLAKYEARTAEANQKALEAALELTRFREPRRSLLTQEALASITAKLRTFPGTQFDSGYARTSGEQQDFWWDLEPAIVAAGWVHVRWSGTGDVIIQGNRPLSGDIAADNVEIHLHPESRSELEPAAKALVVALNEAGIATRDAGFNTHSGNTRAVHIMIGEKR